MDKDNILDKLTMLVIDAITADMLEKLENDLMERGIIVSIKLKKIDYDFINSQAKEQAQSEIDGMEILQKKVEENSKVCSPQLEDFFKRKQNEDTKADN